MQRLARLFALFIFLAPLESYALALGDIELHSALNQPLDAQVELLSLGETELEDISVQLASAEAFERVGLERPFYLTDLRFVLEERAGKPYLLISTKQPLKEPFVDFLVEVEWPNGRLLREYTLLLDPPVFLEETPAPVEAPQAAAPAAQPVAAPASRTTPAPRPPMAAPGQRSTGDAYGPVSRSDTLWSIARQVRPDESVTVPQVMVALLRNNPEAFYKNNVNYLKAGYVLRVPDPAAIAAIDPRQAEREIMAQNQQWQDARRQRAERAVKRPLGSGGEGAGAAAGAAGASQQGGGQPRLRLVVPETEGGETALQGVADKTAAGASAEADLDALRRELALALETSEVSRQENAELRERLSTLEEQIASMQRLLSLRDDTMAALQSGAVEGVAGAPAAPAGSEAAQTDETTAPEAGAAAPAGGQGQAPATPPRQAPSQPSPDLVSQILADPMLLGAAGGVALLILALVWVMVRRRRSEGDGGDFQDFQASAASEAPAAAPVAAATAAAAVAESESTGDEAAAPADETMGDTVEESGDALGLDVFQPDEDEIDTLAEADVYLAYRRFDKAEDLLKEAIAQEPHRHDYVLKLLEVYVAAENRDAFIAQAEALHAVVGDAGSEVWDKVQELGRQFVPDHPLFAEDGAARPAPAEAAGEDDGAAALAAEEEAGLDEQLAALGGSEDLGGEDEQQDEFAALMEGEQLGDVLGATESAADETAAGADAPEAPLFGDLGGEAGETEAGEQPVSEEESLDLDFDLGDLEGLETETDQAESAAAGDEALPEAGEAGDDALFAAGMEELGESAESQKTAEADEAFPAAPEPVAGDEVALAEATAGEADSPATAEGGEVVTEEAAALDLEAGPQTADGGEESPEDAFAAAEPAAEPLAGAADSSGGESDLEADIDWLANLGGGDLDLEMEAEEEESELISGEDEVSTKLDLARAYIDMGDQESARSILDEVLNEGNDDQKGEAEELIRQIG